MAKKSEPITRRVVGIQVLSGGRTPPQAHLIYESTYLEENTYCSKLEYGGSVHSAPTIDDINPTGTKARRKKRAKYLRSDLETTMLAATLLIRELERACMEADGLDVQK